MHRSCAEHHGLVALASKRPSPALVQHHHQQRTARMKAEEAKQTVEYTTDQRAHVVGAVGLVSLFPRPRATTLSCLSDSSLAGYQYLVFMPRPAVLLGCGEREFGGRTHALYFEPEKLRIINKGGQSVFFKEIFP